MAGLHAAAVAATVSTGTSAKTLLRITAPANQGVRVNRLSISFAGTSPTAGKIKVDLIKGNTGGTSSSLTPQKIHGHAGAVQATAREAFSAEGSGGTVIATESVHPQGGYTFPEEILLLNESLDIRVTAPAAVNAEVRARWEE
ncbi:MAG: hypothetical protein ACK4WH_01010 [Phycisphaerales bacterium]